MARVTVSRLISAPLRDVWAVISDFQNAGRWNKSWSRIELTSSQTHGVGSTFRAHIESGESFDFEVCEWSAPERIAFCPIRPEDEPRYAISLDSHVFHLRATEDNETLAGLTANATASGLRGRFVAMFVWPGHQKEGLKTALDSVAAIFEGEGVGAELEAGSDSLTE